MKTYESYYEGGCRFSRHADINAYAASLFDEEYAAYRQEWGKSLSKNTMPVNGFPAPMHLVLEPIDNCNLRCSFCFRTAQGDSNKGTVMPIEMFRSLAREAGEIGVKSMAFSFGEPLLHPEAKQMLECVGNGKFMDIFMYTNGLLMRKEILPAVFDSVTRLHISIDAVDEKMYKERRGGDWHRLMGNIDLFLNERERRNLRHPLLWVSFIRTTDNHADAEKFVEQWIDKADIVDIQNYIDTNITGNESLNPNHSMTGDEFCHSPYRQLLIKATGETFPCCTGDPRPLSLGFYPQSSLLQLWSCKAITELRNMLGKSSFEWSAYCKSCFGSRNS